MCRINKNKFEEMCDDYMKKFNEIIHDKKILNVYEKILNDEEENDWWAHHGLQHVYEVTILVEEILTMLNYEKDFIEEAKIAAILHDIGCIEGKKNHAFKSYELVKKYIKDNKIKLVNEHDVLEAIKIHSNGFQTNNMIASVLILCDKLDIKYNRLTKKGESIKGIRQWKNIKDIIVKIKYNILEIKFISSTNLNKKELEEFYFTDKLVKAIKCFEKNAKVHVKVYLNEEEWEFFK